jgi:hypothetical protein
MPAYHISLLERNKLDPMAVGKLTGDYEKAASYVIISHNQDSKESDTIILELKYECKFVFTKNEKSYVLLGAKSKHAVKHTNAAYFSQTDISICLSQCSDHLNYLVDETGEILDASRSNEEPPPQQVPS